MRIWKKWAAALTTRQGFSVISPQGTAYDLTGPATAPVVVLIHGRGLTRQTWADHLPALADHFRVLTYDLCGHGESALPAETPSLTALSDQLRHLMDRLHIAPRCLDRLFAGWHDQPPVCDGPPRPGVGAGCPEFPA